MEKKRPIRAHMIGKAGEYRVMSELLLRGYEPMIPAIDNGKDIVLDGGLKLQVKTSHLHTKLQYSHGLYRFDLMEMGRNSRYQNLIRDWTTRCDFSVLWCINEDRFFIVPATTDRGVILITSKKEDRANVIDVAAAKKMHASGMSMYAIAKEMGVSWPTVKEHLTNQRRKTRSESMIREVLQYEDRWDLLDVNAAVEGLTLTVPKPGEYPIEIDVSKEKI